MVGWWAGLQGKGLRGTVAGVPTGVRLGQASPAQSLWLWLQQLYIGNQKFALRGLGDFRATRMVGGWGVQTMGAGPPENCPTGEKGGTDACGRMGGGGLEQWASVPDPLFV